MLLESTLAYTERLARGGGRAKKSLGQNYLIDDDLIERIAQAALPPAGGPLLEIGPGLGGLTRRLLESVPKLWAVEIDRAKADILRREFAGRPLEVLTMDALDLKLGDIWGETPGWVVGNLPYYITSPILMHYLQQRASVAQMVILVQLEVAQRLTAVTGSKAFGLLTVATRVYARAEMLFAAGPEAFRPQPKVISAAVRLTPRLYPGLIVPEEDVIATAKLGFAQRRKTILNNLSVGWGLDKDGTRCLLERAGVNPGARAEELDVDEWQQLTLVHLGKDLS
jgi:16S rRNA (adenine1518-N6/adenine1519-N6)-dimethyltransferase